MQELDRLAQDISIYGLAAYEGQVRAFADWAYRRGIAPVVATVLADPTEPLVARERAFARLASATTQAGLPVILQVA